MPSSMLLTSDLPVHGSSRQVPPAPHPCLPALPPVKGRCCFPRGPIRLFVPQRNPRHRGKTPSRKDCTPVVHPEVCPPSGSLEAPALVSHAPTCLRTAAAMIRADRNCACLGRGLVKAFRPRPAHSPLPHMAALCGPHFSQAFLSIGPRGPRSAAENIGGNSPELACTRSILASSWPPPGPARPQPGELWLRLLLQYLGTKPVASRMLGKRSNHRSNISFLEKLYCWV